MKNRWMVSHRVGRLIALAAAAVVLSAGLLAQSLFINFVDADAACPMWPAGGAPYELSQPPNPASSLQIFVNGILWAAGEDFALNGAIVTLLNGQAFSSGDVVTCRYRVVALAP